MHFRRENPARSSAEGGGTHGRLLLDGLLELLDLRLELLALGGELDAAAREVVDVPRKD